MLDQFLGKVIRGAFGHAAIMPNTVCFVKSPFGRSFYWLFWDNLEMKIDPKAVGERIRAARLNADFKSPAELADVLYQNSEKKGRVKIKAQTIRNWENGDYLPTWANLDSLAEKINTEVDVLLFGDLREEQLRKARPLLELITQEEAEWLRVARRTTPDGQKTILGLLQALQKANPVPDAEFRRLEDKRKK